MLSDAAIGSGAGRVFTVESIDQVQEQLNAGGYVCGRALATVVFLSLKLGRPFFKKAMQGWVKLKSPKRLRPVLGATSFGCNAMKGLTLLLPFMNGTLPRR